MSCVAGVSGCSVGEEREWLTLCGIVLCSVRLCNGVLEFPVWFACAVPQATCGTSLSRFICMNLNDGVKKLFSIVNGSVSMIICVCVRLVVFLVKKKCL